MCATADAMLQQKLDVNPSESVLRAWHQVDGLLGWHCCCSEK
jgi:hypothetical protein